MWLTASERIGQGSPRPGGLGYGDSTFISREEKYRLHQVMAGLGALERGLEIPSWKLFSLGGPTPPPGRLYAGHKISEGTHSQGGAGAEPRCFACCPPCSQPCQAPIRSLQWGPGRSHVARGPQLSSLPSQGGPNSPHLAWAKTPPNSHHAGPKEPDQAQIFSSQGLLALLSGRSRRQAALMAIILQL